MDTSFFPEEDTNLIRAGTTVFSGALLMADISGFTEITETLTLGGREGVEELTSLLNRCFHRMLETVSRFEGSVITFSGDSILVRFRDPEAGKSCAAELIRGMREFRRVIILDGRFSIDAKAVVGTGSWNQYIVGSRRRAHVLVSGGLVREIAEREKNALPGEVIVFDSSSEAPLEDYAPPETDSSSFLSPGSKRLSGEHRPVTPVFITVRLKKEVTWSINAFQQLFLRIQGIVERHGGHLHHLDDMVAQGTRLMALFGAPVSEGRDTLNGVLAALEMMEMDTGPFILGCGADSGYAFSGTIGDETRKQYTVIGDPVNTAARLAEAGEPRTVLVSSSVVAKTSAGIRYGKPVDVSLKGKKGVREAFKAAGRLSGVPAEPFVGRETELAALVEICLGGKGPVLLTGSAGVGKSSLLGALARELASRGKAVFRGISGVQQSGNSILSSLLMSVCGIQPGMSETEKTRKYDDLLASTGNPQLIRRRVFPGNMILRLGLEDEDFRKLPPKLRSENLLDALVMLFSSLNASIIIEDVHRADAEELGFLFSVMEGTVERSSTAFILSTRPEGEEKVPLEKVPVRMPLDGLSQDESSDLLTEHLGGLPMEGRIREALNEKARGNPFFLVQFLLYLREKGLIAVRNGMWVITGDGNFHELPESVFSMIMARIDTLEEKTRESLKVASVVGMRFSESILSSVVRRNVHSEMSESMKAGLTFINSYIELEHIFSHMLIRDVAYDSLLTDRRRELHREIGSILEEKTGGDPGTSAFLAMHFLKGEVWDSAVEYSMKAGDLAYEEYRNREGLMHFRTASEILEKHLPHRRDLLALCLNKEGNILDRTGDFEGAKEAFRRTVAISRDSAITQRSLMSIADIHFNQGNLEEAEEIVEEVERLVAQSPDDHSDTMIQVSAFKAWSLCISGKIEEAEKHALRAVELGEGLTGFSDYEKARKLGHALNTLATVHWANSDFSKARELYERAIEIALENGLKREAAVTWGNIGLTLEKQGCYEDAVESIQKQLKTSTEIGEKFLILSSHGDLGMTYAAMGDFSKALHHASMQLELAESMKVAHDQLLALNHLATVNITLGNFSSAEGYMERAHRILDETCIEREMAHTLFTSGKLAQVKGDLDRASEEFQKALDLAEKVQGLSLQHLILLEAAEVQLAKGDHEKAGEAVDRSIKIAERTEMESSMACSRLMRGRILERTGKKVSAENEYRESMAVFERIGTRYYLARALYSLGTLLRGSREADEYLNRASDLFDQMDVPNPDL